jgi:hypothetical protein
MNLYQESGGTAGDRMHEAEHILSMIRDHIDEMEVREQNFIVQMDNASSVSPKQLLWLRDLKEKYL